MLLARKKVNFYGADFTGWDGTKHFDFPVQIYAVDLMGVFVVNY